MGNFLGLRLGVKLGEGRLGEVHELLEYPDAPLGSRLVIKRIHPALVQDEGFRNRLRALIERLPKFRHPFAEEVLEARILDQSTAYLICERLDGESLAVRLRRDGRLSLPLVRQVARQAAEVLTLAHSVGLVHGNLSPRSIVIMQAGREDTASPLRIKLRGLGCAPPLSPGLFGTPSYLAPEQVDLRDPRQAATPLSDQHALACVCHEALVGRLLFPGETVEAVRPRLVRFDAPHFALRGIDPSEVQRVDHALQVALAKDPASRFESLRQFVDALEGQRGSSRVRPLPAGFPPAAPLRPLGMLDSAALRLPPSASSNAASAPPPPPSQPPAGDSDAETQPWIRRDPALLLDGPGPRHAVVPAPVPMHSVPLRGPAGPLTSLSPRRTHRFLRIAIVAVICIVAWMWHVGKLPTQRAEVLPGGGGGASSLNMPPPAVPMSSPAQGAVAMVAPSLPVPIVTPLMPDDQVLAEEGAAAREPEPPGEKKPGRKRKPAEPSLKTSESAPAAVAVPRPVSKRPRGHACRVDNVPQEYPWLVRLTSCFERKLPAESWPQHFELQLDRRGQLVVTTVDDPDADTAAQGCLQVAGAVDVQLFPENGLTLHCR